MNGFRPCVIIPTYDNPRTIRAVVLEAKKHLSDVFVIDDGSGEAGRQACEELAREGLAHVHHRAQNGGKGAAVKTGFELAVAQGFSHALQVDADGQHDLSRIERFLSLSREKPKALILGYPVYDHTLNKGRYAARLVTRFWNYVEVLGPRIGDSMCGFRVYPLAAATAAKARADRMAFDVEIPVRMVWNGVEVVNEPVPVRYLAADEGGVSHYHALWDTLRISWTHTRLCCEGILLLLSWPLRRLFKKRLGAGA